jgi:hypothetical protein
MYKITRRPRRRVLAVLAAAALAGLASAATATASPADYWSPQGYVTSLDQRTLWVGFDPGKPGSIGGWAADRDRPAQPIGVVANIVWTKWDCQRGPCVNRTVHRTSVAADATELVMTTPFPPVWAGPLHRYVLTVPPAPAEPYDAVQACITAINVGRGHDTSLGCYALVWAIP